MNYSRTVLVCDMNCNNVGNYFKVVGLEGELEYDEAYYIVDETFYPKVHCYRARGISNQFIPYKYSEAIDILIPEDYMRWKKTRFGGR